MAGLREIPGMRTILLHIHNDCEQESRLQVALDLARLDGGHICCVQVAPVEAFAVDPYGGMFGLAAIVDTIHEQDRMARLAIEARLLREGVAWDWRCYDGSVVESLIDEARLTDVVVLSQPCSGRQTPDSTLPIVGDIALHTRAPVLMVPRGCRQIDASRNVLLAWNGSSEAAHALRLSLPLLAHAGCVHVVEVSDDARGLPSATAAVWLARHGIAAELHDWPAKGRRPSVALLHAVAELDARYVVMGAYGHSRLRETVLGGVTRELIEAATVPLLLAH
jgi:nucleotide-binding universal stress UspA family protein